MANHVYSTFELSFKTQEECTNFAEWIGLEPRDENIAWPAMVEACCNIMMDNLWPENEPTRQWWLDNVGAKWMYFDDIERNGDTDVVITMTSAWDFPEGLFFKISDFVRERYQDVTMTVTFEDESYCFIGAAATNQQFRDIDYFHPDFDEMEAYRDEDEFWTEEFYEQLDEKKEELLNDVLEFIQQDLEQ